MGTKRLRDRVVGEIKRDIQMESAEEETQKRKGRVTERNLNVKGLGMGSGCDVQRTKRI